MSEINSLVAGYLQNNSSADASDVVDRIKDLGNSIDWKTVSVFDFGDDGIASEDELLAFMANATGKEYDEIEDDVSLLFDILNTDEDNSLSSDELSLFSSKKDGGISNFGTWNQLSTLNEDSVETELGILNSSSSDETDTTSSDDKIETTSSSNSQSTGLTDDERIKTDSNGNSYVLVEQWQTNDSSLNSCLYYIIQHSYDFEELGISYSDAKDKLLSAIVDTNNISNANLVYTNQKIILPDAYEVLGLESS